LHEQRRFFKERVQVGGVRVRDQQHVRCFDAFPASDRRAVECVAGFELVFVEVRDGNGHVLFLATGIGKTQINELDFVVLQHLHYICGGPCHSYLLSQKGVSVTPTGRSDKRTVFIAEIVPALDYEQINNLSLDCFSFAP
jgi:hypothetical protein